ncbi:MAG: hypothetical protein NTY38_04955 [Acidobacteria bacterium]|nr:hypothetical protein [Acidobacteriota bacterium]
MRKRMLLPLVFACMGLAGAEPGDWIAPLGGTVTRNAAGRIVAVKLRGSWISDFQMSDLARLPELERLDLSHTRISDEGMLRLKTAPRIAELNLYYAEQITDQGMTAIRGWKHLKRLNVRGTRISDGTLETAGGLAQLEALDIANTGVTGNGYDYLITLTKLRELSLGGSRLGDSVVELVRLLPTLTRLDLSRCGAVPEAMLGAISELKDLRVLELGFSDISGGGLRLLRTLPKVEKLSLVGCARVDDAAAAELAGWAGLKQVDLQETKVTEKGLEAVRRGRPGVEILSDGAGGT